MIHCTRLFVFISTLKNDFFGGKGWFQVKSFLWWILDHLNIFQSVYKNFLIWPTFNLKTASGLKKAEIKIFTYNRLTVLNKYHFYGPIIFRLDKNPNFYKLNLARSKKFFEQLVMIIVHNISHFEGYLSIFQPLIFKAKLIFDACQMIIFWSLLFGGQRLSWGQKLVRLKNGYKLIERYLDNLNFIIKKFSPEINHYLEKSHLLPC